MERYWTYQIARAMQALTMGEGTTKLAERHSKQILALEKWLHIDVELALQHLVMKSKFILLLANK